MARMIGVLNMLSNDDPIIFFKWVHIDVFSSF